MVWPTSNELLFGLISILVGIGFAFLLKRPPKLNCEKLSQETELLIKQKKQEIGEYMAKVKEKLEEYKQNLENHYQHLKTSTDNLEKTIKIKEESLGKKEAKNTEWQKLVTQEESNIATFKQNIKSFNSKLLENLAQITSISVEDAKASLLHKAEEYINENKQNFLTKNEEIFKENAQREAKNILLTAINRYNMPTSVEKKSSIVKIPRDTFYSLILVKNGEFLNIFEKALEVDIVFNDMPSTITVSGFDLVKRNVATLALGKLSNDHVVNEAQLNKRIQEAQKETEKIIEQEGEKACKIIGLKNVPHDFIKIIGRLKFRTSYGQNILLHSLEVSFLASLLASEIGADIKIAKIAGFLHDLGKAVDHEIDESHDKLTKDIMTKFGFSPEMIHAAWAHHEAEPLRTSEAKVVKAADALSAGRPGARQESLDKYLDRIKELEETAYSFSGVKKSFAISAGRELRVIVDSEQLNDEASGVLAKNIADKIHAELSFPGKIKVNVIRYTRAVDFAK